MGSPRGTRTIVTERLKRVGVELRAFPSAAHDDVVDALASVVAVTSVAMPGAERRTEPPRDDLDDDYEPTEIERLFLDVMPNPPDGYEESYRMQRARRWRSQRGWSYG